MKALVGDKIPERMAAINFAPISEWLTAGTDE